MELNPEGKYHLRYTKRGKQVFEPVGADAHMAVVAKLRKEHLLQAAALGANVVMDVGDNRLALAKAVECILLENAAHRAALQVFHCRRWWH